MNKSYALVSVSDKTGIVEACQKILDSGIGIIATGGTAKKLQEKGIEVTPVEEITEFPEILEGRVKTMHPKIIGGLLARRKSAPHQKEMEKHKIPDIKIVLVNLYPFTEVIQNPDLAEIDYLENIDIGGITLLRSAAKNYEDVIVITEPEDYELLTDLSKIDLETRKKLALKAWQKVLDYDMAISNFFHQKWQEQEQIPYLLELKDKPKYGENPHQSAGFYQNLYENSETVFEQANPLPLSYNNYLDISSAIFTIHHFQKPTCVINKHTNPCGIATGDDLEKVIAMAWQGDSMSAFGSVIALNRPMNREIFKFFKGKFVEVLCAPEFEGDFVEYYQKKRPRLRLVKFNPENLKKYFENHKAIKSVVQGYLVQEYDRELKKNWQCVTKTAFPKELVELAEFGVIANKCVTSNSITLVSEGHGIYWQSGAGFGQPNRVGALQNLALPLFERNCKEIAEKMPEHKEIREKLLEKTVLISDAFFPFADSIEIAAKAGIRYIIQPGGSKRDSEVIEACNKLGIAMIFTGMRHFRHS